MRKISIKFSLTTEDPNTRFQKKITKRKIKGITRGPKDYVTNMELLRGYLKTLNININNTEIMTRILSNKPKAYKISCKIW